MNIKKYGIFVLFFASSLCLAFHPYENQNSDVNQPLFINQSVYSIDKNLLNSGYRVENINNHAVMMYQNKPITATQFYMPAITKDKALKLYIEITDTIKNAAIYLNDSILDQKTSSVGSAYIDLYRERGNYHLKLVNMNTLKSNNYYFALNKSLKLVCRGTKRFDCIKVYY